MALLSNAAIMENMDAHAQKGAHAHRARQTQTGFIIPQCSIVEGNVR